MNAVKKVRLQNGAMAYLRKPFQREDLLKLVNHIESQQLAPCATKAT